MKRIWRRLRAMSQPTAVILRVGLLVCNGLLAMAIAVMLQAGDYSLSTYSAYILAHQLEKAELAVLFLTVCVSAFTEEQLQKAGD